MYFQPVAPLDARLGSSYPSISDAIAGTIVRQAIFPMNKIVVSLPFHKGFLFLPGFLFHFIFPSILWLTRISLYAMSLRGGWFYHLQSSCMFRSSVATILFLFISILLIASVDISWTLNEHSISFTDQHVVQATSNAITDTAYPHQNVVTERMIVRTALMSAIALTVWNFSKFINMIIFGVNFYLIWVRKVMVKIVPPFGMVI